MQEMIKNSDKPEGPWGKCMNVSKILIVLKETVITTSEYKDKLDYTL